ncbi:hypothetical protein ACJX0J_042070, partial [Zea mays]
SLSKNVEIIIYHLSPPFLLRLPLWLWDIKLGQGHIKNSTKTKELAAVEYAGSKHPFLLIGLQPSVLMSGCDMIEVLHT